VSNKRACGVCIVNFPPEYCPYCGAELDDADPDWIEGDAGVPAAPARSKEVGETDLSRGVWHCEDCDDFVFDNPCPGGSVAVVDREEAALLLVEDFRHENGWKLPSGRMEYGESPTEGAIRELTEETGLTVDADDLRYAHDTASEPVEDMHLSNVTFAVERALTEGPVEAGDDAVDAQFWTADKFAASDATFTDTHVDRFGTDSFEWLFEVVSEPLAE